MVTSLGFGLGSRLLLPGSEAWNKSRPSYNAHSGWGEAWGGVMLVTFGCGGGCGPPGKCPEVTHLALQL